MAFIVLLGLIQNLRHSAMHRVPLTQKFSVWQVSDDKSSSRFADDEECLGCRVLSAIKLDRTAVSPLPLEPKPSYEAAGFLEAVAEIVSHPEHRLPDSHAPPAQA